MGFDLQCVGDRSESGYHHERWGDMAVMRRQLFEAGAPEDLVLQLVFNEGQVVPQTACAVLVSAARSAGLDEFATFCEYCSTRGGFEVW